MRSPWNTKVLTVMFLCRTTIYSMDSNSRFTIHQQIATLGAQDALFFQIGSITYLSLSQQDKVTIYKWDSDKRAFIEIQSIGIPNPRRMHIYLSASGKSKSIKSQNAVLKTFQFLKDWSIFVFLFLSLLTIFAPF